ncbi:MAG: TolC family protein [Pirellulaceae bacterium]
MRPRLLTAILCLALAGCQTLRPPPAVPSPEPAPRRLPATGGDETRAAAAGQAIPPAANQSSIQLAQHVEPMPAPPPEPLPQAALRPVALGRLTLADLEQMALAANPSVGRAAALVQAARGNWIQAGLPPNPVVGYEGQQIGSAGRAEQDGVFVEQEFVRGGKLRLSRQVAAQEWARLEQELAAQQQRVITDVRIAFYQVLIAERQVELSTRLRDIAAEASNVAEALLKGLEVGRVDLVQSQLELGNAEILAQNARNRFSAAWRTLATVLGNPDLPPQPLDGNIEDGGPELIWETSRERLLTSSPEIAAAMAEIQRARWALERANVEQVPNVTVAGLVNWRDNGIDGDSDGGITVGLPLPLWNRNQGGIVQAQGQVAAAERALDQLELSLENRLVPVFERYSNALHQANKYRGQLLPAARQALDLVRRLYQAGETPYLNLLTAQRSFSQTNVNYLESLRELRAAETEIDGLLLSGSLESR